MKNKPTHFVCSRLLVVLVYLGVAPLIWGQDSSHSVVVHATKHVLTPPLRQIAPVPPKPLASDPASSASTLADESANQTLLSDTSSQASSDALTSQAQRALSVNSGLNILGIGAGFPGYTQQANIPVSNGAAGATQYVQFVNDSFAVFNKSTGSVLYGPVTGNTLWQSLGAPCSTSPNIDESAQYDQLANVWVLMMPVYPSPSYLCIAVSTTSDATGSWNLYAFEVPVNVALCHCRVMPDYPKLSVWPDAYYISYHQAWNLTYEGPAACAVNRIAMLSGSAATMQCFTNTGTSSPAWLPSDLDGSTLPPSGSPNYYLAFDTNDQSLDLWQFHVDWNTPSNSTFTGPANIPVASFLEPCGDGVPIFTPQDNCVPQAGTTQMLGAFGDELMYRVAYRNLGGYQALVAQHTVQVASGSNQTGIRWYELQNTGSGFGIYQQGTYAPDSNYRWMGSIAMDKVGDIALGYSVSSGTMSPSIRITGQQTSDALDTMESETDILSAAGISSFSQTGSVRWGDFSSMAIDPSDDCTFWYTNEYQPVSGKNKWATRIASFGFPSCTGSWTLTASESGQGTVTSTDGGINCTNGNGACSAVYSAGTQVTLNASPANGFTFSGWSGVGACNGTVGSCTVMMNGNLAVTATFTPVTTYTLAVNESGQGTVKSTDGGINCTNGNGNCSAVYNIGAQVTLNATAASGFTFTGWSGVGACNGTIGTCNVTMNSNLTTTATFAPTPTWAMVHKASKAGAITSLTVSATGSGHLIAVALMFNGTTSVSKVSDNAGNSYISAGARVTNGANSLEIWYAEPSVAGATVITPTFAGTPNFVEIAMWEVSGVLNMPLDAKNTVTGTVTLNNTPGAAVTTTMAGDFVISALFAVTTNFTAISTGNEFTNDFATYGNGAAHITSNSSVAGTHQASWYTANPTGPYLSSTVAFGP